MPKIHHCKFTIATIFSSIKSSHHGDTFQNKLGRRRRSTPKNWAPWTVRSNMCCFQQRSAEYVESPISTAESSPTASRLIYSDFRGTSASTNKNISSLSSFTSCNYKPPYFRAYQLGWHCLCQRKFSQQPQLSNRPLHWIYHKAGNLIPRY
jgi:hypothetical protein